MESALNTYEREKEEALDKLRAVWLLPLLVFSVMSVGVVYLGIVRWSDLTALHVLIYVILFFLFTFPAVLIYLGMKGFDWVFDWLCIYAILALIAFPLGTIIGVLHFVFFIKYNSIKREIWLHNNQL